MQVTAPALESCRAQAHPGLMKTATHDHPAPLLVSELPATPTHRGSVRGTLQSWHEERRALRELRAFEHILAGLDSRTRTEVLSAARRAE